MQKAESELSEIKKENAILKEEISKMEAEKQPVQTSVNSKYDSAETQKMLRTLNVEKSDMVKECFLEMNLPQSQRKKKLEYCVNQNRNNVCKQKENGNICVKANKVQKLEMRLQNKVEQVEEFLFLEKERNLRKKKGKPGKQCKISMRMLSYLRISEPYRLFGGN